MAFIISATGRLTAETPVAVSPPNHVLEVRSKKTHKLPRIVEYRDGVPTEVPVIPASTFRGVLRHAISGLAFHEQLSGGGAPLTVNDYVNTAQGGIVDRKEEGEDKPLDFTAAEMIRKRNPIVGLFGNFGDKIPSRLLMRHAALEQPTDIFEVAAQVRTDPIERDADLRRLFSEVNLAAFSRMMEQRRQLVRLEDRMARLRVRDERIKSGQEEADPEKVKALRAELEESKTKLAELEKGAGGSVNLQQITPTVEAIAPGATLRHGFTLNGVTELEAAVALLAFETWIAAGARLGANRRSGYGCLSGYYDLEARPAFGVARLKAPVVIGRLSWSLGNTLQITATADSLMERIVTEKSTLIAGGMGAWTLRAS